ncbi:molybdate ABC transporter substrate-binding protein [Sulfuriroseicoccus oceanibius]|uniref:Molybdate ABC transporter substrate-binding protein n=1 Tax=Sulfuriroseicoccus oceanibius TaxID=2707525 RepID=A0A7T7F2N5_9BACT|nr:molybdate ABC transporter substrate-binding protein [Sulfuriroseicoccus oceanibius]QQL45553.1 molybdate ABC transporter substrate-binding protein [Sulfuriroseicoccus oceanibius]
MICLRPLYVLCVLMGALPCGIAGEIKVAVASNFAPTLRVLADGFEKESGHEVIVVTGSTGKLYAQIVRGAPYDVFLAADAKRPELLEKQGAAVMGSRVTYAVGRLVLWSRDEDVVDEGGKVLMGDPVGRLAIANPRIAPYGQAALETLEKLGRWGAWQASLVRGENAAQTWQFVESGAARLGMVARSHWVTNGKRGAVWLVPAELHQPLVQQAVRMNDRPEAVAWMRYLQSDRALQVIRDHGYDKPDAE